jgi:ketosteroid isomerase-like protein
MTDIRELLDNYVTAMKKGDADWIVQHRAPDMTLFSLAPPLKQPDPRNADELRAWFGTFDGPVDFEIRDVNVAQSGDIAYCHGLVRLSATPAGASERFDLWFRGTYGLRRENGAWLFVHEHESTPFYMDGEFGAALDLTP